MQTFNVQPGRLITLDPDECWDLVRSQPVGRIAWSGSEGVSVTPVNYTVADDHLLIRTTPYSLLARDCHERDVAFEVGEVSADLHAGWSVLLRGRCQREERPSDAHQPWVTGPRTLSLRIDVRSVTGRRVKPPPSV